MKLGDIFAGRYRLLKHLGTGGMGVVVLAEDIEKGNVLVALKFVRSELANDTRAINDLRREVVNAQKLTDRHIVRVHDLMKYGDRYFISMEYVEGEDLNTRLGRYQEHGRNFSVEEVLEVARDVCPAIDYAHEQRVLHLDIKPGNIIAMKGGGYKIMDFGIARSAHESMTRISRAPGWTGGYAPPEQIEGRQVDRRADVYALSATFYDLLAGHVPHPTYVAKKNVDPEPIKGVPDNVNRAILKGLAKNPDDRFRTAGELLMALEGERVEPPFAEYKKDYYEPIKKLNNLNYRLFIGSCDKHIYCISARDGKLIWKYRTDGEIYSSPIILDDRLYIGSCDSHIYCLSARDGKLIWKYKTDGEFRSSPNIFENRLYIGSNDCNIYCISISDNELKWKFLTGNLVISSPQVVGNKVYVGSCDDFIYCLLASNGKFIWKYKTSGIIFSSPSVKGDRVYVGTSNGYVYCFSAINGNILWCYYYTGGIGFSSPYVISGNVYIGSNDKHIYCLSANNGKLICKYKTDGKINSSPCVIDEMLYIGSDDGNIYCIDTVRGGEIIWAYKTGTEVRSTPTMSNGMVFFGSMDWSIYCLSSKDGDLIWKFITDGGITSSPYVCKL